jgi:hypothetical protein
MISAAVIRSTALYNKQCQSEILESETTVKILQGFIQQLLHLRQDTPRSIPFLLSLMQGLFD